MSFVAIESLSIIGLRRAGGAEDAEPKTGVVAGQSGFRDRRQVRGNARALGLAGRQGLDRAGLDESEHGRGRRKHDLNSAGDEIGDGLRATRIKHAGHLYSGHLLEQFGSQGAGRCRRPTLRTADSSGFCLASAINSATLLTPSFGFTTRMLGSEPMSVMGARSFSKFGPLPGIIVVLIVAAIVANKQRVAVVLGARDIFGCNHAAGAGMVLDDDDSVPRTSPSFWPTMRAATSALDPAANPTTGEPGASDSFHRPTTDRGKTQNSAARRRVNRLDGSCGIPFVGDPGATKPDGRRAPQF